MDFTGLATEDFITQKLKKFEEENTTASLLFLSDVWLDKEEVFDKLHELFSAYQSVYIFYLFINYVQFLDKVTK